MSCGGDKMKYTDKKENVITATELKKNLGKYLDYVTDNNEVVITKNGHKIIRMSPYITDIDRYMMIKEEKAEYISTNKKVSYEEFIEISNNTTLRLEYINGEIHVIASPNITHQRISGKLHLHLNEYLKGKECDVFYSPFDIHFYKKGLKTPDVMQPDVFIVCDLQDNTTEQDRYTGTPTLVIEILSKSSRSKDMVIKLNTYMMSGVKEFWVVDPDENMILQYGFSENNIDTYIAYKSGETLKSYYFENLSIIIDDIFK
jgi:prevent-host-death family protein